MKEDDYYNILLERQEHSCISKKEEEQIINIIDNFDFFQKSKNILFLI